MARNILIINYGYGDIVFLILVTTVISTIINLKFQL